TRGARTPFAVVPAAAPATRFGRRSRLVGPAGAPLLHTAVTRAAEVTGNSLIVVLGAGAAELAPLLKHSPGTIVVNHEWREGLASSIRAGIARLPASCAAAPRLLPDQAAGRAGAPQRPAAPRPHQPPH